MHDNSTASGEDLFAISTETAVEFLFAHLCASNARRLVDHAAHGAHDTDPDEFLHLARLEAAEAQHHIQRAALAAQRDNKAFLVVGTLGPLFNALELQLDAIRYRAHTPFLDVPYWGRDLDFAVEDLPEHIRAVLSEDVEHKVVAVTVESSEPEERIVTVLRVTRDH